MWQKDDRDKAPGLELEIYKRWQSGSLGPEPPAEFRDELRRYDKRLFAVLQDNRWKIYRWGQCKFALKWPNHVATVEDKDGNPRTPTRRDIDDLRDFADLYGPRWNGNVEAWLAHLDKYEEEQKKAKDVALNEWAGSYVDKHIKKLRREFGQFNTSHVDMSGYRPMNSGTRWGKRPF